MKKIKKNTKILLTRIFEPIIKRMGYEKEIKNNTANSNNKNSLLAIFFSNLLSMGFMPKHIVDVGANHGTWTKEALKYFPDAFYTLIEPQYWLKDSFEDILNSNNKVKFYAVGAGEKDGSFQFTILNRDDSSSFRYSQEEAKAAGFEQINIPVVTLNKLLSKSELPIPDIIKIDAEGLDIEVLKGSSEFFGKTEIFMVEAGVVNKLFDNSFLKIINFMNENGYILFDITDINRPFSPRLLWLVELVFVKKKGILDSFMKELDI
jgi:FkbM family methyltransferase